MVGGMAGIHFRLLLFRSEVACSALDIRLQTIQRALHPAASLPQHVRIKHRRGHIVMPQQLLNRPNVRPALEGVGGKAVTLMPSSA
jgi:hypothetical protein